MEQGIFFFFQSKGGLKMIKISKRQSKTNKFSEIKGVWGRLQRGRNEKKLNAGEETGFIKN